MGNREQEDGGIAKMVWTCDYKRCDDYAQWVREHKGELFTLCTKHHALLDRKKWSKHLDVSKLSEDDIRYLLRKERRKESARRHPFEVRDYPLDDGTIKVRIRDKQTGERRSFVVKPDEKRKFIESFSDLEKRGFSPKPSIDQYVKKLRKEEQ